MYKIKFIFISLIYSFSLSARELILIPKSGNENTQLQQFYLFSPTERNFLLLNGKRQLANALKIEDLSLVENLSHYYIEENQEIELSSNKDHLLEEQWGLLNQGLPVNFDIDDITTLTIPGKRGEDIGLTRLEERNDFSKVLVAILDTGVDLDHPELKKNIFSNEKECKTVSEYKVCLSDCLRGTNASDCTAKCDKKYQNMDSDGNGYPLDCNGWNPTGRLNRVLRVIGNADVDDQNGHGTHIAGVIAAENGNGGVKGIAQNAIILPVKVINTNSGATNSDYPSPQEGKIPPLTTFGDIIARGMLYALRQGAQVINMSLGWPYAADSMLMRKLVELANEKKVMMVAAAGNDSTSTPVMPCLYPGAICVGAHNPDGSFAYFSNFGSSVDIVAPGQKILSTWPMDVSNDFYTERPGYGFSNGTSMAAPFVAGSLAYLIGAGFSPDEALARLLVSARAPSLSTLSFLNFYQKYSLSGNLDLYQATKVSPGMLILPANKDKIPVIWDGENNFLSFKFKLKNFWKSGEQVKVIAQLKSGETLLPLQISSWEIPFFESNKVFSFDSSFIVSDKNFSSELFLDLSIVGVNYEKTLRLELEVNSVLERMALGRKRELSIVSEDGSFKLKETSQIRTIDDLVSVNEERIVSIDTSGENAEIALLKKSGDQFQLITVLKDTEKERWDNSRGTTYELLSIQRLSGIYQDDKLKTGLVFVFRQRTGDRELPRIEFRFYSDALVPIVEQNGKNFFSYDNKKTVVPENFQWVNIEGLRYPAWVASGELPAAEIPRYDPWFPINEYERDFRFYYLKMGELRTLKINLPEEYFPAQLLHPNSVMKKEGIVPVLLAKGYGHYLEFFSALMKAGKITQMEKIEMPRYHMLGGILPGRTYYLNHTNQQAVFGNFFGDDSAAGKTKITSVTRYDNENSLRVGSHHLRPHNPISAGHRVAAYFENGNGESFSFTQTQYEMQFHNHQKKSTISTSLKRFSFMPGFFFDRFFYPIKLKRGAEEIPGIYVPGGLATSLSSEIILPMKGERGEERLVRPARFRVFSLGCKELNPSWDADSLNYNLNFACNDRIVKVPLTLE